MTSLRQEYLENYGDLLASVVDEARQVTEADPRVTIEVDGGYEERQIRARVYSPQPIWLNGELHEVEVSEANGGEDSDYEQAVANIAVKNVVSLRVMAARVLGTGESEDSMVAKTGTPPWKAQGVYRAAAIQNDVMVDHTRLRGLPDGTCAERCMVNHNDDFVDTTLKIWKIGRTVTSVAYEVRPDHDEDLERWEAVLGPAFNNDLLLATLSGIYGSEPELDQTIAEVQDMFKGTEQAEAAKAVLDEMRRRAITAKKVNKMKSSYGLDLPPEELLHDTLRLLQSH